MRSMIGFGLTQLFRGARRGQAGAAAVGAAVALIGWLRRRAAAEKGLLYARNLKDGEGLTVRLERGRVSPSGPGPGG